MSIYLTNLYRYIPIDIDIIEMIFNWIITSFNNDENELNRFIIRMRNISRSLFFRINDNFISFRMCAFHYTLSLSLFPAGKIVSVNCDAETHFFLLILKWKKTFRCATAYLDNNEIKKWVQNTAPLFKIEQKLAQKTNPVVAYKTKTRKSFKQRHCYYEISLHFHDVK